MFKINSIGVSNFRSLSDTGFVNIKPITILVGKNSSGKSTFARLFPLLKQSAEASKRGPLLWWGRLVDFGGFDETLSRSADKKEICIKFEICFSNIDIQKTAIKHIAKNDDTELFNLKVAAKIKNGSNSSYVSIVEVEIFDYKIVYKINEEGIIEEFSCNSCSWKFSEVETGYAAQDKLIPVPIYFKSGPRRAGITNSWEIFNPLENIAAKNIRCFLHGNTAEMKVRTIIEGVSIGSYEHMYKYFKNIDGQDYLKNSISNRGFDCIEFKRLCDSIFAAKFDDVLSEINFSLDSVSRDVVYLEPLRANAQRYYRQQSLAIGEIDSKGENIAMFLDNLRRNQILELNAWMGKYFGIQVFPVKKGGHVSLNIKQVGGGGDTNIADMGFGFSQMLPIAIQLWAAESMGINGIQGKRNARSPIIVIEQPELHLHPDFQAKLADVFVAAVGNKINESNKTRNRRLRVVIETHSSDLINRFGSLVGDGLISRDDIQIILFEQPESNSSTNLVVAEFDDDGVLVNWPLDFFIPSVYG